MEYYDSMNRAELHEFYFNKSKKVFQHPKVLKFLDEDINDTSDIKLFEPEQTKQIPHHPAAKRRSISSDKKFEELRGRKEFMRSPTVNEFKVRLVFIFRKN